jgi:hypothetical protein
MTKISQFPDDNDITVDDKLVGTDAENSLETRNFTFSDVISFLQQNLLILNTPSFTGVLQYADNAAAVSAGLAVGKVYRTGDVLKIVH